LLGGAPALDLLQTGGLDLFGRFTRAVCFSLTRAV